jgi:hypothetical protein
LSVPAFRTAIFLAVFLAAGVILFPQEAEKLRPQKHAPHVSIPRITPHVEDVSTLDGIIKAYYDVISGPAEQPRQWDRDATLYITNVRFIIIREDAAGKTTAQSMTHQEFVDSSDASLKGKPFYEHEIHRITHRAGNVAHILSTSEHMSSPNGPAEGRSVDSLELFWDGTRWWITNVSIWDTDSPKYPLPSEFLP